MAQMTERGATRRDDRFSAAAPRPENEHHHVPDGRTLRQLGRVRRCGLLRVIVDTENANAQPALTRATPASSDLRYSPA